jgi:hypothetical protein
MKQFKTGPILLRCRSLFLALSGHRDGVEGCLLLGVKRTSQTRAPVSANDPQRSWCFLVWPICWVDFTGRRALLGQAGFAHAFGPLAHELGPQEWIEKNDHRLDSEAGF